MHGYAGRLLRVNLSTGRVGTEPLDMPDVMNYIGGRGLGIKYLYNELKADIDPLGEDNKLLLCSGVLNGTPAQCLSRWVVCTKSPLSGCYARSSAGGDFGAWLKFAGYDFIIIEGKADRPVYLSVMKDSVRIEDAGELWGKDTAATQEWLYQRHGKDIRVACIGPAGENLVKYAAIVTGRRTASRCGVGTVMGAKKLKAVVIKARRNLNLHSPESFKELVKEQIALMQTSKEYYLFKEVGTTGGAISRNSLGIYPTRNFRYGQQEGYEKLSPEAFRKLRVGEAGCYGCPIRCGKIHFVPDGPYAGARSEGPEYEGIWAYSGPVDNTNLEATIAADQLCDDLGIDALSTGGSIGFAYELYEKGIITKKDTDGLELAYGNHAAMITLIKKIGRREGFGDILADGTRRAAQRIGKGAEAYAMQVKGVEIFAYEPRGLKTAAFGAATSNIGGGHGYGSLIFPEMMAGGPKAMERFNEEGKAGIIIHSQNQSALNEVGCVCVFTRAWGDWFPRLFGKMLMAATGINEFADWDYLCRAGERIVNLDHAFNVRDGFDRKQDTLPRRLLNEPLHTGTAPGEGQMVRTLDRFLDEYYRLRGWTDNGIPTKERLEELGLGWLVKDMDPFLKKV